MTGLALSSLCLSAGGHFQLESHCDTQFPSCLPACPSPRSLPHASAAGDSGQLQRGWRLPGGWLPLWPGAGPASRGGPGAWRGSGYSGSGEPGQRAARAAGGSGAAGSGGGAGAQQHPAPAPAQMLLSLACGCTFGLGVITCTACPGMRLCGEATHCPIPRGAAGTRWGRALRWHLLALLFAASRVLRMPHFLPAVSISVRAPAPRARPGKGYHTAQSSARHHNGAGA